MSGCESCPARPRLAQIGLKQGNCDRVIALAGNPNTGKSTLFNSLTGLRQHTGNWPGKTVARSEGSFEWKGVRYKLVDLPGTYSLLSTSPEEEIAGDFIRFGRPDCTIVVMDATALERNLNLALQILAISDKAIICVNLIDEAERKGVDLDLRELSDALGVPAVATVARTGKGLEELIATVAAVTAGKIQKIPERVSVGLAGQPGDGDQVAEALYGEAERISRRVIRRRHNGSYDWSRKLDSLVTSRIFGLPLMLLLLAAVFWVTIVGANYPSQILTTALFWVEAQAEDRFSAWGMPWWVTGFLWQGVYRGVAWVVSVMLPPMAIFFPLFTVLEDWGYLPRVAFNLDWLFKKAGAHGKQALTMAMGFGCNAAGVIACRVIDSPRERLIAILTNTFVPCNGRFPTLIMLATVFVAAAFRPGFTSLAAAASVVAVVLLGVAFTLLVSWTLSRTILRGEASAFVLELPPYRRPSFLQILYTSLIDRTIFVLLRAMMTAAPAGAVIWILANVSFENANLAQHLAHFLNPVGSAIGLDGVILLAFVIAIPANEIVVPTMLMIYLGLGMLTEPPAFNMLRTVLVDQHSWSLLTAVNVMLFSLLHNPCATTLVTIWRETHSRRWTLVGALMPLALAFLVTFLTTRAVRGIHWILTHIEF